MKIYLDDTRENPPGWEIARNFRELKSLLEKASQNGEKIERLSLDNDLGEGEMEGYQIMKWLSENYPETLVGETICDIHSANPVGHENMEKFLEFCRKHKNQLLVEKENPEPTERFGEKFK